MTGFKGFVAELQQQINEQVCIHRAVADRETPVEEWRVKDGGQME